jgi:predicted ribosomally synthesized peptide with SipW-like signal peptide
MKKKAWVSLVAVVLVLCCAVGGTLAWLTDKTGEVKNTFSPSDINITLTETPNTDTDGNGENDAWKADMIPGFSYTKDPVVTVKGDSVDCYLFVKFEEKGNPDTYLKYTSTLTVANGWTQGDGTDIPSSVWYRKVTANAADQSWNLLNGDTIAVKDTVAKDNMADAAKAELVYTAYATQLYKSNGVEFSAAEAWDNVPNA